MPRRHASTREVVKNAQLASHGKSGNPYTRHPLAFKTPVLRHPDAKLGFRQRSRLCFQPRPQRDKTVTFKPSFRPELKEQVSETKPGSKDQGTRATYLEIIQISGSFSPLAFTSRREKVRVVTLEPSSILIGALIPQTIEEELVDASRFPFRLPHSRLELARLVGEKRRHTAIFSFNISLENHVGVRRWNRAVPRIILRLACFSADKPENVLPFEWQRCRRWTRIGSI